MSYLCCNIDAGVQGDGTCYNVKPGIKDVRISCYKSITSITETVCPDAKVTEIVTEDDLGAPNPAFYTVEVKTKSSSQAWEKTYDQDTGNRTSTETFTLTIEVKTRAAYCAIYGYVGQVVSLLWQENGTDRWYISGRAADLYVTSATGGTGTDEVQNIVLTIAGNDIQSDFVEVFDTDAATTQALVDSVTV